jgi:hypothetical protein
MGTARLKAGIWKLRRIMWGFERQSCPLCLRGGGYPTRTVKYSETKKWRQKFIQSIWLSINEDMVYNEIKKKIV